MRLSAREAQILDLLQLGLTNKEIGIRLAISHNTARDCITELMRRFDVKGRAALAALHSQVTIQRQLGLHVERRTGMDRRNAQYFTTESAGGGGVLTRPLCSLHL